jgi:photosystem II stability/assembly factor-like uncharacterized protein
MKLKSGKIIVLLVFVLCSLQIVYTQSGWFSVFSNFPTYAMDFDFINELTGFVICNSSKIMKSNNGGYNWFELNHGQNYSFGQVTFINQDTGYFVGYGSNILITTNQGNSFINVNTSPLQVFKIDFVNNSTGFALASYNKLAKTTNSGFNWLVVYSYGSYDTYLTDIEVIDVQSIFVSGHRSTLPSLGSH